MWVWADNYGSSWKNFFRMAEVKLLFFIINNKIYLYNLQDINSDDNAHGNRRLSIWWNTGKYFLFYL